MAKALKYHPALTRVILSRKMVATGTPLTYDILREYLGETADYISKPVMHNTTCYYGLNRQCIAVALHGNTILRFHPNGTIDGNDCGYQTVTTKHRLSALTGLYVSQMAYKWYVGGKAWQAGDWNQMV